jgi:hypothetical protein
MVNKTGIWKKEIKRRGGEGGRKKGKEERERGQ